MSLPDLKLAMRMEESGNWTISEALHFLNTGEKPEPEQWEEF